MKRWFNKVGFRKADIIVYLGAVLILVASTLITGLQLEKEAQLTVIIEVNGKKVYEALLDKSLSEYTVEIDSEHNGYNIVKIEGSTVSIIESNCSDQICVHSIPINKTGQAILCIPHKLVVRIIGNNDKDFDVIT